MSDMPSSNSSSLPKCFDARPIYETWIFANSVGNITIKQEQEHGEPVLVQIPPEMLSSVIFMLRSAKKELAE